MIPPEDAMQNMPAVTFDRAAAALAGDFERIFVVRLESGCYTEYTTGCGELEVNSSGTDFFYDLRGYIRRNVVPEDQDRVLRLLHRERLKVILNDGNSATLNYRMPTEQGVLYNTMKVICGSGAEDGLLFIGMRRVSKSMRSYAAASVDYELYSHISRALARRYEVIYLVNLQTGAYTEYSCSESYARLNVGARGTDFFGDTQRNLKIDIYPEDYPMMAKEMEREQLLQNLAESGTATLNYRLMLDGKPQYVTLTAIQPEDDEIHLIIAVSNVDAAKRREIAFREALGSAMDLAHRDALTGTASKHAYVKAEDALNTRIEAGENLTFAVAVCDINGLKKVNDTQGHLAGDAYIKDAADMVSRCLEGGEVFRVGGDEFAVLLRGPAYEKRTDLLVQLTKTQETRRKNGQVTVACGLAEYEQGNDRRVQDVFDRADRAMYENKKLFR